VLTVNSNSEQKEAIGSQHFCSSTFLWIGHRLSDAVRSRQWKMLDEHHGINEQAECPETEARIICSSQLLWDRNPNRKQH
jgi:hypothetical protein